MLPEDPVKLRKYAYIFIVLASAFFGRNFLTSVLDAINAVTVSVLPQA